MSIRLKEVLSERGITQKELAERLGISVVGMSKIATGNPTVETLEKIAKALDIEMWELFKAPEDKCSGAVTCPHCGHILKFSVE